MADINNTIDFPGGMDYKQNPAYDDKVMLYDPVTGKPVYTNIEDFVSAAGNNVIGSMTPSGSPSGSETNGQSYRVSNDTDTDQVFTNFSGVTVPANSSGLITLNGGSWVFVKDQKNVDLSPYAKTNEVVLTSQVGIRHGGKNLFDSSSIVSNEAASYNSDKVTAQASASYKRSAYTSVDGNQQYTLQGVNSQSQKVLLGYDIANPDINSIATQKFQIDSFPFTFTTDADILALTFNVQVPGDTAPDFSLIQLEEGGTATAIEPFKGDFIDKLQGKELYVNMSDYPTKVEAVLNENLKKEGSKNIFDKNATVPDWYVSPGADSINGGEENILAPYMSAVAGNSVTIQGLDLTNDKYLIRVDDDLAPVGDAILINTMPFTFVQSAGASKFTFTTKDDSDTTYNPDLIQVEIGDTATAYVAYVKGENGYSQINNTDLIAANVPDIVFEMGKNLFNKANIIYNKTLQNSTRLIINASGAAYVKSILPAEGDYFTLQGVAVPPNKVMFLLGKNDLVLASLVFTAMPFTFYRPAGVISVAYTIRTNASYDLNPDAIQLEAGQAATTVVEYTPATLKSINGIEVETGGGSSQLTVQVNKYPQIPRALAPSFSKLMGFGKGIGEMILALFIGDSILSRESNTSVGPVDPSHYPPGITSNNLMAYTWRQLNIKGDSNPLRYDVAGVFTETGTFTDQDDNSDNDDYGRRPNETRVSLSTNAAVSFVIDTDTDAFAWEDRTEINACDSVIVNVAAGNGKWLVYNGTAYVEANGYVFSQEKGASGLTHGNTLYGRIITFKAVTSGNGGTFTIGKNVADNSKFLYWGIVTASGKSPWINMIVDARGNKKLSDLDNFFMDNINRNPDIIVLELPLINDLIAAQDLTDFINNYWDRLFGDRPGNENSGALWNIFPSHQILFLIPPMARQFFNADGTYFQYSSGATSFDVWNGIKGLLASKGASYIDLWEGTKADMVANGFTNIYDALTGSGETGNTYTKEDIHPNDKATKVEASHLCPVFTYNTF